MSDDVVCGTLLQWLSIVVGVFSVSSMYFSEKNNARHFRKYLWLCLEAEGKKCLVCWTH